MRCPKCGFISFDHLEMCKKCHKSLADLQAVLNGTTYDAAPPEFLAFVPGGGGQIAFEEGLSEEMESVSPVTDRQEMEFEEKEEVVFSLDDAPSFEEPRKEIEFPDGIDSVLLDLNDEPEELAKDELALHVEEPEEDEASLPSVDFADLDISDLAPSAQETSEVIHFEEAAVRSDVKPETPQPSSAAGPEDIHEKVELEDLNISGLDLDIPAKLVIGSAAGKRLQPSVRTGTALDKFDINLGELFSNNKN
ncbi:hypothetical protein [Desulfobulbus oligotrophicus]|uniref:Uncharacterized protein n=1 Tax=Desulfobulbus oligotrophicus TaxID=1909699 RepID=A0A7T6AQ13_9BACT|nr:hypothetical protein [Desulfobulbus oligotrophicus]MDY0390123.1 hypothetical protein [Desulfobulbus oligotrophicus]QQG65226.1 hypothetical protein HP555_04775 [Desulfobulbus oligotrophicus]